MYIYELSHFATTNVYLPSLICHALNEQTDLCFRFLIFSDYPCTKPLIIYSMYFDIISIMTFAIAFYVLEIAMNIVYILTF